MSLDDIVLYNKRTKKDDNKLFESISRDKVKCKNCGHTMIMTNVDRMICSHCGYWVYKNDELEFKYSLEQAILKEKQNERNMG